MKFGSVLTADALGSILAHSVALPQGRLRKGVVLGAHDIAVLRDAQINEITVATLEEGDIDENGAADRLADALMAGSTGLRRSQAFTGRVNLIAQIAGVADLDVARLHAVNAVDPMITVATVPPHHQLRAGDMVATIKMISYAVPEVALVHTATAAQGAIDVAGAQLMAATLIITQIAGGAGEKGRSAIEDRLTALGVKLEQVETVPHDRAALSAAIGRVTTPLLLILTGSATSDINDVAPAALVQAGGTITRFGMPVDPGNLLFLGALGDTCVIGLPGCARSPALNGADWVLARMVCAIDVSASDIASMGVGGLLKEIPTRPQPRRPKTKSSPA